MKGMFTAGVLLVGIIIYLGTSANGETQGVEIKRIGEVKKWMRFHGTNSAYIDWKTKRWVFKRDGKICKLIPNKEKIHE